MVTRTVSMAQCGSILLPFLEPTVALAKCVQSPAVPWAVARRRPCNARETARGVNGHLAVTLAAKSREHDPVAGQGFPDDVASAEAVVCLARLKIAAWRLASTMAPLITSAR